MKRHLMIPVLVLALVLATVSAVMAAPAHRNFSTHLDREDAGVTTLAQGQAIFQLSKDGHSIEYKIIVANIENVTMAHIHLAPPGQNGPVAVWLHPSAPPAQLVPGRFSGMLAQGTITAANLTGPLTGEPLNKLVQEMAAGRTYVNVHTQQFPAGEIRGQIGVMPSRHMALLP